MMFRQGQSPASGTSQKSVEILRVRVYLMMTVRVQADRAIRSQSSPRAHNRDLTHQPLVNFGGRWKGGVTRHTRDQLPHDGPCAAVRMVCTRDAETNVSPCTPIDAVCEGGHKETGYKFQGSKSITFHDAPKCKLLTMMKSSTFFARF